MPFFKKGNKKKTSTELLSTYPHLKYTLHKLLVCVHIKIYLRYLFEESL